MLGAQVPLRWSFDPGVLGGIALLTIAYLWAVTRGRRRFPKSIAVSFPPTPQPVSMLEDVADAATVRTITEDNPRRIYRFGA